ncbi:MAG TPA: TetR/AcrR family transcriptional regulator [Ktedonobacterales bacterium]|nr:TetR/AcrR family transcriptional regulator [Ktedonobacterales bacterium]
MEKLGIADAPQTAPTRGARRKSETRRRLLRAARAVFAREGLENATIAQITREADVGFGTFYLHFATKEEAYRAVVTDGFGELAGLLGQAHTEAMARGAPWWELARDGVRAYCAFAERNRELFLVMFAGGSAGIGLGRELQERFAGLLAAQLAEAATSARAHGQPAPYPYPAQPVALATVVALTRSVLWWLDQDEQDEDAHTAARPTLDALVEALTRFLTAALWGQTPTAAPQPLATEGNDPR